MKSYQENPPDLPAGLKQDQSIEGTEGIQDGIAPGLSLEKSISLLRATLESTADGILVVDADGRIVTFNQQFVHLWNLPLALLETRDDQKAIDFVLNQLKDPDGFLKKVLELYGNPDAESYDVLEFKDGRVVERYSKPQKIGGKSIGRVWSFRDVTQRRLAEEALKESEERYRRLVELSPYAIAVHSEGKIIYINKAGVRSLGGSDASEVIGKPILDFVHPDYREMAGARIAEMLRTGRPAPIMEEKILRLDGNVMDVEIASIPLLFRNRPAVQVIVHDITDRKRAEEELRKSEERYRSLVKQSKEGVFIFDPRTKKIQETNDVLLSMLGYKENEISNLTMYDLIADNPESVDANIEVLLQRGQITIVPRQYRKKDGSFVDVEVRASLISYGNSQVCLVNITDVAERKRAHAIQSALYRVAEIMSTAQDMQDFYSSIHDIFSELMYARNFYIALYDGETGMLNFPYYVDEFDPPPPPTMLTKGLTEYVLRTGQPLLASPEIFDDLVQRGEVVSVGSPSVDWLGVPLKSEDKTFGVLVVQSYTPSIRFAEKDMEVLTFVSQHIASALERKRAAEMIRHLAYHDSLTGLPNRTLFKDRFLQALAHSHRKKELLAMLFLDLDRFKTINDTLGHASGDRLLQAVSERLKKTLREGDTVARLGGDEFMILLSGVRNVEDAAKVAEKILLTIRPPFHLDGHDLHISTSIGISLYPYDGHDPETLLKNADIALYRAKDHGRNNYQLYTAAMNARALEQLALENSLRRALERAEFILHYQPLIDMQSGKIIGTEALIRWARSTGELYSPDAFIPIAEDTGLIVPMGEWVLRTACRQNRIWQLSGLPSFPVAVNLSARQFQQQTLIQNISRILTETELDPRCLVIEITESTIMKNADVAIESLKELKAMGIQIAIDDFGTGYSSLSYLKQFPFDALKIDKSFVHDCINNADDAAIVTAIISMAHSLKVKVVAEGVETERQQEFLKSLKCDRMQGYLFSKPLPSEAMSSLLIRQQKH